MNRFTSTHWRILLGLLIAFSLLDGLIVAGMGGDSRTVVLTALGAVLGPFSGAVARDWQSCCTEFSLYLLPFSGGMLAAGLLFQLLKLPFERGQRAFRLLAWTVGWLGWFLGGIVSFGHALS